MIYIKRALNMWQIGKDSEEPTMSPVLLLVFPEEQASWEDVLVTVVDQEVTVDEGLRVMRVDEFKSYDERRYTLSEMWCGKEKTNVPSSDDV